MNTITVQYCASGQYGEFVAKSEELTAQQMIDEMWRTAKHGVSLRFLGSEGFMLPTGYSGDSRVYIPSKEVSK